MTEKVVKSFRIKSLKILDEEGHLVDDIPSEVTAEDLRHFYTQMLLMREFDRKAVALQRQGRIGTYPPMEGQEACQVGSGFVLRPNDWLFPSFREQGVFMMRGVPLHLILLFYMGSEEANRMAPEHKTFPVAVPVASQMPIAVGCGMAMKLKKQDCAVVTYFGDGATSEGDFAEALNFASVYNTPNVFICQNNQWAISIPVKKQTHSLTLAQKASAYDMDSLQVDGNDVLAVYKACQWAFGRARRQEGPTFLELVTYRVKMHTTADDPKRYQDQQEVELWQHRDPIRRLGLYLRRKGIIDDDYGREVHRDIDARLMQALAKAEEILKTAKPEDIFAYTYATMPENLREQLEEYKHYAH